VDFISTLSEMELSLRGKWDTHSLLQGFEGGIVVANVDVRFDYYLPRSPFQGERVSGSGPVRMTLVWTP
jgi:hypothetical protein